ncbi:hypothetical protein Taro_037005 [Colocasia esculenta]|uniref:Uncharacterized protein n=1 Tax=Colocasia esculenta TaxID=4460 RepID=A0A843WHY2_COLES|nr:hypothetical protein [Colocasia esculenta]
MTTFADATNTWCLLSCRPSHPCFHAGCPNAVEIAAGNWAGRDMTLDANRNTVHGHGRVFLGTDNTAGRDQEIYVNDNNVYTGWGSQVRMGTGNYAGGDMRMNVSGNRVG